MRAKRQKEIDWLDFGRENDHLDHDGADQSIFRTPRAGVGDDEVKDEYHAQGAVAGGAGESYAMHEAAHAGNTGFYPAYGPDEASWGGYGANVVGEMPTGYNNMAYGAYYPQATPPLQRAHSGAAGPMAYPDQGAQYPACSPQLEPQQWPAPQSSAHSHATTPGVAGTGAPSYHESLHSAPSPAMTGLGVSRQRSRSGPSHLQPDGSFRSLPPLPPQTISESGIPSGGDPSNSDQASVSATAVSHGREGVSKAQRRLSERERSEGGASNAPGDDDFVLPYDRDEVRRSSAESPRPEPKRPLHLVNPDDDGVTQD